MAIANKKKRGIFLLILASSVCFLPLALASGELDGKLFVGLIGNKGEGAGTQDTFEFKDGKFTSLLCSTFGYSGGIYQANVQDDAISFESEITNANGGKMNWKGTVKGEKVEGIFLTQENGQASESWFKGVLKK